MGNDKNGVGERQEYMKHRQFMTAADVQFSRRHKFAFWVMIQFSCRFSVDTSDLSLITLHDMFLESPVKVTNRM
jgi:hypothetical protein